MTYTADTLSQPTVVPPAATVPAINADITAATYQEMLTILNDLVTHTHIFYDDYTTNCNCNCNTNCSRGIL